MDVADVALRDITPLRLVVLVKRLEISDGLFLLVQVLSSFAKLFRVILSLLVVPTRLLRLQLDNFPGVEVGEHAAFTDGDLDIVEAYLEAAESVKSNELARRAGALKLVRPLNLLAEDMPVAHTENLGAEGAVLVAIFVEEEPDATLGIFRLHLRSSNGHSESSSEMPTDVDGGVLVTDNA